MLPAHPPAALPALPHLHRIAPNLRLRLHRDIRGGDHLLLRFSQPPATVRTALSSHRHWNGFCLRSLLRRVPEPEGSLAGLSARRLRISFVRAFGKRRGTASALQLLDIRLQPLDHAVLVENDLNQLIAAECFQLFQDPGCTNLSVRSRTFKLSATLFGQQDR